MKFPGTQNVQKTSHFLYILVLRKFTNFGDISCIQDRARFGYNFLYLPKFHVLGTFHGYAVNAMYPVHFMLHRNTIECPV